MIKGKSIICFWTMVLFFLPFFLPELALCSMAEQRCSKSKASPDKDSRFPCIFITKHRFYTDSLSKGSLTHFPVPCSIRFSFFLLLFIYGVFKGNEHWEV